MSEIIPGPVYRIHTPRLVLRCWEPGDAVLLMSAIDENLEHLREWMLWAYQEPTDLQDKIKKLRQFRGSFDLDQDYLYGIFKRDESMVLGSSGLHTRAGSDAREIGYWIHKDHINQGLATEASGALTRVAFEVDGVRRVEIHCDPTNVRSAAVPRKLGFTHEATLRERTARHDNGLRDDMIWTLFREDYPDSWAAQVEIEAFDAIGRRIL